MSHERTRLPFAQILLATGEGAPSLEDKEAFIKTLRKDATQHGEELDRLFLAELGRQGAECRHLREGLKEAKTNLKKVKEVIEKLGATPWHPAVYLGPVTTSQGWRAIVLHNGSRRVVGLADGIESEALQKGEEVFLGAELNVIITKSPDGIPKYGETAHFDRKTADSRIVANWRDEEFVLNQADSLKDVPLQNGDLILWRRDCQMAFEKLEKAENRRFLLEDAPDVSPAQVGGQDDNLDSLLSALLSVLFEPKKASVYGIGGKSSILMVGPPGCGKTLMARVAASEVSRVNGKKCRFGVVKPAEWESPWVGVTQQNIRECFKSLREAAKEGCYAILFMDEIEAVGRIRGGAVGHHSDKFLNALLAELDGFTERKNIAIIAATNRKDLVDPALLERLSEIEITVSRPDQRDAKAIFSIHLPPSLPYSPNGSSSLATHDEAIETAVSLFYSPNCDNAVCVIRFRDGRTRAVTARELASGRVFEQVCRSARRAAFLRDVRGGEEGIRVADMDGAVAEAIQRMRTTLTPGNVHAYLSDLPQDVDVVAVEPVMRHVEQPHRYLNLSRA